MRTLRALMASVALLALMGAAPAPAQTLDLKIARAGALLHEGRSAELTVTAMCPDGAEPLEAFVYVTQNQSSTKFAPLRVTCDGSPHTSTVRVLAHGFVLQPGRARASGYLLLSSGDSVSPGRCLRLS